MNTIHTVQAWTARFPNGAQATTTYGDLWQPQLGPWSARGFRVIFVVCGLRMCLRMCGGHNHAEPADLQGTVSAHQRL